jgi:SAM-dependent methyltransferase
MGPNSAQVNCPVCGVVALLTDAKFISCQSCGLQATRSAREIFSTDFEKDLVGYPEDGSANTLDVEDKSFWFSHRGGIIKSVMDRFTVTGAVLDVGGGNGFETLRLQNSFSQSALVEPGLPGCYAAKERGVRNIIQGTLESLKIKSGQIAGVCFFDVIEHLEKPQILLREANRILKFDGRIYVTVPAYQFLWSDEDEYAQHKRRYSKKSLYDEITRAGFKIEYISYCFMGLVWPIFIFRTLPSRFGLRAVQKMNKNEHASEGLIRKLINSLLKKEIRAIRAGRSLSFGSSIVCVAKKIGEPSI